MQDLIFTNQLCLMQLQVDRLNSRLDLAMCGSTQSTDQSHDNSQKINYTVERHIHWSELPLLTTRQLTTRRRQQSLRRTDVYRLRFVSSLRALGTFLLQRPDAIIITIISTYRTSAVYQCTSDTSAHSVTLSCQLAGQSRCTISVTRQTVSVTE